MLDSPGPSPKIHWNHVSRISKRERLRSFLTRHLRLAVGSAPRLGTDAPPLLFLVGRFDQFLKSDQLRTRTDGRLVISPWSDHGSELFDPVLIHAAVNAACGVVGKSPPTPNISWRWHVLGLLLALSGASGLVLVLPVFPGRWEWAGGCIVAVLFGVAFFLTMNRCLDLRLDPQHFFPQIVTILITLLVLAGARKWDVPRWVFALMAAAIAMGCVIASAALAPRMSIAAYSLRQPDVGLISSVADRPCPEYEFPRTPLQNLRLDLEDLFNSITLRIHGLTA
jgi:hypothetical protein